PERDDEQPRRVGDAVDEDGDGGINCCLLLQGHFAPANPPLIQSSPLTLGGGLTQSAGKRWMSTSVTIFFAASYLVRPMAVSCVAWCPLPRFMRIVPAGDSPVGPGERGGELLRRRLLAAVGRHRFFHRELEAQQ